MVYKAGFASFERMTLLRPFSPSRFQQFPARRPSTCEIMALQGRESSFYFYGYVERIN